MLLSNCTTVERVEKLSEVVAYSLLDFNDTTEVEARGSVLAAAATAIRGVMVHAFLATAREKDRAANIVCIYGGYVYVGRRGARGGEISSRRKEGTSER